MRDGQIEDGRVWFGFELDELQWLYDLIPHGDDFKNDVWQAIGRGLSGEDNDK